MCVALPGRIVEVGASTPASVRARVDVGGKVHAVDLVMVPEARVGDYVVMHSGYALRRIGRAEAEEAIRLLAQPSTTA